MSFDQLESGEKREREISWAAIEQSVENMRDKLGRKVDGQIKPAVVALRASGFTTTESCEGHVDHSFPWPWIEVESAKAEELIRDPRYNELKEKVKAARNEGSSSLTNEEETEYSGLVINQKSENEKEFQRLKFLLEEFYSSTSEVSATKNIRLGISKGSWNQSRLEPLGVPKKNNFRRSSKDVDKVRKGGNA